MLKVGALLFFSTFAISAASLLTARAADAGVSGYSADAWYGLFAPRGTSRFVVAKLSATIIKSLQIPEKREKLIAQGVETVGSTQEEFLPFLRAETEKRATVVKAAGVKPE